ncbi:MAG: hypothetical protein EOO65_02935 [Methanosarcinales archaeon]|nr:MAG: hypothetical protein EOO65_02935 [Methanosarcinales archaeon]
MYASCTQLMLLCMLLCWQMRPGRAGVVLNPSVPMTDTIEAADSEREYDFFPLPGATSVSMTLTRTSGSGVVALWAWNDAGDLHYQSALFKKGTAAQPTLSTNTHMRRVIVKVRTRSTRWSAHPHCIGLLYY